MKDKENLIKFISEKYKVTRELDGSYTIFDGNCTYSIREQGFFDSNSHGQNGLFDPLIKEESTKSINTKTIDTDVGRDDIQPSFNPTIKRNGKIQGMFPSFGKTHKPLFQTDPSLPGKNKKNYPEPDPDNFDPGRSLDEFDN